jgi:2'-5' RNA ligase
VPNGGESALLIEVPEAEEIVARLRLAHDPVAARGVPAHITILFPFCAPDELDDAMVARVRELARAHAPFAFTLEHVQTFTGTVWLAPNPADPFVELTLDASRRFPGHPPYGGLFPEIIPHLTVGHCMPEMVDALCDDVTRRVAAELPVQSKARALSLWAHEGEEWRRFAEFPLGG